MRRRVWLLLIASFIFYASWSHKLALLIVASTMINYCIGLGLESFQRTSLHRALLTFSITANLGLLCFFKYSNFFLGSLDEVLIAAAPGVVQYAAHYSAHRHFVLHL